MKTPLTLIICCFLSNVFGQQIADTIILEEIIVIPSPFFNYVDNDHSFGNLHWTSDTKDLEKVSFLNDGLLGSPSVHINDGTTNPIGQDLQIRGFRASPLYGLAQEIAVFADGVKKNDLLGDVVFWDLMPTFAMNQAQVFAGSQPLFGLNALGGTINYTTKSGFTNPGGSVALSYGSFNRMNAVAEYGQSKGKFGYYFGGNFWREDGWRDYSESQIANVFGKLSFQNEQNQVDLSLQYADSDLLGNGAFPIELLDDKEWRNQVFTHPDQTQNELFEVNASWQHKISSKTEGRFIAAYKKLETDILNGDESPFEDIEIDGKEYLALVDDDDGEIDIDDLDDDDFALARDGSRIQATDDNSEAILNQNAVSQSSLALAYSLTSKWHTNNIAFEWQSGISFRTGEARYTAGSELGDFDETRRAIGSGEQVENFDTDVISSINNLHVTSGLSAVFNNNFAIQLSGAFNRSDLILEDQLGVELNGDHDFSNFSGALSFYYLANKNWMVHGTLNTSTRNPTAVEVSCADPDAPCRLPNAFLSDPPLEVVRATTAQVGFSYEKRSIKFSSTGFVTNVSNDIYFVSAGPLRGSGYFDNVGNTRRVGWENSLEIDFSERLSLGINYTLLQATFRDAFTIPSPNHPNEDEGEIEVEKGDHLALVPRHYLGLSLSYNITDRLNLTLQSIYNSSQYVRGDEANELDPIKGYWKQNAALSYSITQKISTWVRVINLTNAQYQTFGLLGEADEAGELLDVELTNNVFGGPAAPRYFEAGIRVKF